MSRFLVVTILLACGLTPVVKAQTQSGESPVGAQGEVRVAGVVHDAAGGRVAYAEVRLMFFESIEMSVKTNADGEFDFGLMPGAFQDKSIRVNATGFAPYRQGLTLRDASSLEIVLAAASVNEQVVVSATRTATRLNETPASVVVINREQLQTTAAVTIDDALRQVPGFQLFRRTSSRTANPTTQGVSLRGTGASGASRALVLADGVPLTDPFGGWIYWGRVPRESVNRIEVLRGAASDLYGSGALGGVVSIEKRTTNAPFSFSLETSYGTQNTPDASLWVGGRRGRWGASVAAEGFRTDGYIAVAEGERGAVDTAVASRRTSGEATIERFLDENRAGLNRLFLRAATYGEDRRNGTPLQTNSTGLRQFSFGADGGAHR
jgi:outer membrane cobalamin receptor